MTALSLYKFITEEKIECHWHGDELVACLRIFEIEGLLSMLAPSIFDDGGLGCQLFDGYIGIDLSYICEYYGIDPEEIVPKGDEK